MISQIKVFEDLVHKKNIYNLVHQKEMLYEEAYIAFRKSMGSSESFEIVFAF